MFIGYIYIYSKHEKLENILMHYTLQYNICIPRSYLYRYLQKQNMNLRDIHNLKT